MAKRFATITDVAGYVTLPDKTNAPENILVASSQNVLIDSQRKVTTRKGYSLQSAANAALNPIEASFDWNTSSNVTWNLRAYDDELEVYLGTVDGVAVNAWTRVADGWSAVDFIFTKWWDTSETIDLLLFVNGDSNIYDWSGAVTTIASATTTTITKNGTDTWATARFLTAGTRSVEINGTTYTYTGGESTTTLTGVTPDPSSEAADSVATQSVRTNSNKPASGFDNDTIKVNGFNQIAVGSNNDNEVYISSDSSFTDFTFSSPRVPGEGALLVLNDITNGFGVFEDNFVIFSGKSDIFKTTYHQLDVGSTLTETLEVNKIKTSTNQSAQSQRLITEIGDGVAFLTHEPALRILQKIEEIEGPQIRTYSNPIKVDFDAEDFTNGHMLFDGRRLYISSPVNDILYILQFEEDENGNLRRYWQPPQVLPARQLSIISDEVHLHSSRVPETYKLFDGLNDNGVSFTARALFSYRNFGDRANFKRFNEYFVEGYIGANTTITTKLRYDFDGANQLIEKEIVGTDEDILFESFDDEGIGQQGVGETTPGGSASGADQNPKFRKILVVPKSDFFEIQTEFYTDETDYAWEILAHGPNVERSSANAIKIRK